MPDPVALDFALAHADFATTRSRDRHRSRQGDRHKDRDRSGSRSYPFVGCDGEGSGKDDLGRQNYMLFRIGDDELYTGQPLKTLELLKHICQAPKKAILVGFSFGYDVTMILRDLDGERRSRLLAPKDQDQAMSRYTWFGDYGIEYLPKQYFRVCRLQRVGNNLHIVKGSSRTIFETFGFFQSSFLKTLKNFNIGSEYLELIERNKAARETFDEMTDEVREYNRIECQLLAELMEHFREVCHKAGIRPRTWNGAGKLAASLHQTHATLRRTDLEASVPPEVRMLAHAAYYGGRFEVTRVGQVPGPIHEYDIRSAYPAAMRELPCLVHGRWEKIPKSKVKALKAADELFVASLTFTHSSPVPGTSLNVCGLPIRTKKGHIYWPVKGAGIYWSPEIAAAEKLGLCPSYVAGWRYIKCCDCHPFDWVEPLYEYRKSIGSKTEGYPIKLGINSLYGKLAQRIGKPQWGNFVWAGLITAITRARLMDASSQAPHAIVMLATDGIYSTEKLDLDLGDCLGQWEHAEHPKMFVVQPGLYWGPPKPKTRGIPPKFFETRTDEFEKTWAEFVERSVNTPSELIDFPKASVRMTNFIGIKLAQARNKPETAGCWVKQERRINFDWTRKRRHQVEFDGYAARTFPQIGSTSERSVLYSDLDISSLGLWEGAREELEEQPDYVDLSPPWKD